MSLPAKSRVAVHCPESKKTESVEIPVDALTGDILKEIRDVSPATVNVVIGDVIQEKDINLFFGPLLDTDVTVRCPINTKFPHLLKALGCFRSTSDAKNNGWNKDITEGFHRIQVGKAPKLHIFILKRTQPWKFSDEDSQGSES